jgi:PAS domain S-box-containing protein
VPLMLLAAVIEERQAEHAKLRESQQRYALATAASGVGVWEWRSGHTYVDPRLAQSLGYRPRTDTTLEEWLQRVLDEDRDRAERAVSYFLASGEPFFDLEARVLDAAGNTRWLQVRGAASRTSGGRIDHVTGTYSDTTERRNAADALADSQARLRELAGRLMSVQENERARIARNLHDNASQELAALAIRLGVLERDARSHGHADQPELQSLRDQAIAIGEQIRQFAHELHPSILQRAGLPAAIAAVCRRAEADYQLRIEPTFLIGAEPSPAASLCVYRVCQEALLNVAKHAQATRVWVTVTATADAVQLEVRDDGRGFERSRGSGAGIGLLSLDERLRLLQGALVVDTGPGRGTTIRATVPAART